VNFVSAEALSSTPPSTDYLALAAWHDSLSKVAYYLEKFPAQIEEPSAGRTPLLWAISRGRPDAAQLLLAKGANITTKTVDGETALACAVWSGSPEMVQFVLNKGIDPLAKDSSGITPLVWARLGKQEEVTKLLEEATRAALDAIQRKHDAAVSRNHETLAEIARRKKAMLKP
jgi:ankyrin repeat protein